MSQVRNIITNRMINSENARMSNLMGGYIHVNVAEQVIESVRVDADSIYDTIRTEYDWVTRDYRDTQCIKLRLVVYTNGGRIRTLNGWASPNINLDSLNFFKIGDYKVYTNLHCNGTSCPPDFLKQVSVLEYGNPNGNPTGILTYKQFTALSNRPSVANTSSAVLREVRQDMVCPYVIEDGWMRDKFFSRRMTINGEERVVNFMYNSDSHRAYEAWRSAQYNNNNGRIFGYHGSGGFRSQFDAQMEDGKWYFGIEAEKQDSDAKAYADYLSGKCGQWGAERDGSLGRGGAEFISPILPLHNGSFVRKNFQQHRWMLDAKLDDNGNANRTSCGGHMTISKKGMSGRELLTHLHHFVPLFYSLYIGRLNTTYGGAVVKSDVAHSRRAFNLKSFGVEIRIFSGVPSMEGAWWRVQLLQVIADMIDSGEVQSYKDVANALVTDKHPLRKVMRKQYDSKRIRDKFALVLAFGHMYENNGSSSIDISNTSDDVKHKSDRVIRAFNQFRDVRSCTQRLWGVDSITTTEA